MELWSKKQRDTRSSRLQQVGRRDGGRNCRWRRRRRNRRRNICHSRSTVEDCMAKKKADSPCENSACADERLVGRGRGGGHRRGLDQQRAPHMPPPPSVSPQTGSTTLLRCSNQLIQNMREATERSVPGPAPTYIMRGEELQNAAPYITPAARRHVGALPRCFATVAVESKIFRAPGDFVEFLFFLNNLFWLRPDVSGYQQLWEKEVSLTPNGSVSS